MDFFQIFNKYIFPIIVLVAVFVITKSIWWVLLIVVIYVAVRVFLRRDFFYSVAARRAVGVSDYDKAVAEFDKAILVNSSNASYFLEKGYIQMLDGRFAEAKDTFENITSSRFPHVACLNGQNYLAIALYKLGDIDKAISILEAIRENEQLSTTMYGNLTYFYILRGDLDAAVALANEAFEYNQNDNAIIENLARVLHLKGELDKSLEYYEMLEKNNPKYPEGWYNYALLLKDLNKKEAALEKANICLNQNFTQLSGISIEDCKALISELQN